MSIGDVNSAARGSGARFNEGKLAMEYVPASVLAMLTARPKETTIATRARNMLAALGEFEEGGDETALARVWSQLDEYG